MMGLCVLVLHLGCAHAQEGEKARAAARAVVAQEAAGRERGLESIGDEAAEVGADDEAGLGGRDAERPAGGMSTVVDEMVGAADADGCTGAIGEAACAGGDN